MCGSSFGFLRVLAGLLFSQVYLVVFSAPPATYICVLSISLTDATLPPGVALAARASLRYFE